jgi:hypothetical protein
LASAAERLREVMGELFPSAGWSEPASEKPAPTPKDLSKVAGELLERLRRMACEGFHVIRSAVRNTLNKTFKYLYVTFGN